MPIKDITNHSDHSRRDRWGEIWRFVIVGATATLIQYGIYLLLVRLTHATVANTVGYLISFAFNFYASTHFTFRVKANAKRGAGFALSHAINYLLQTLTLTFLIWLGVPETYAPIPMFAVCVPVNFLLIRFFLKR